MNIERDMPSMEHQPISHQTETEKLDITAPKTDDSSLKKPDEMAIARIRTSLGLEQGLSETDSKQSVISLAELRKKAQQEGGLILYHGGLPDDTTLEEIDLDRLGSQQNKRGKTYGGFYLTDESSKNWTERYASERNGNIHGFLITGSNRIVEIQGRDIDRLSQEQRTELAKNHDLIKGKDLLGRVQYVLLNKDAVKGLGIEKIDTKKLIYPD